MHFIISVCYFNVIFFADTEKILQKTSIILTFFVYCKQDCEVIGYGYPTV